MSICAGQGIDLVSTGNLAVSALSCLLTLIIILITSVIFCIACKVLKKVNQENQQNIQEAIQELQRNMQQGFGRIPNVEQIRQIVLNDVAN